MRSWRPRSTPGPRTCRRSCCTSVRASARSSSRGSVSTTPTSRAGIATSTPRRMVRKRSDKPCRAASAPSSPGGTAVHDRRSPASHRGPLERRQTSRSRPPSGDRNLPDAPGVPIADPLAGRAVPRTRKSRTIGAIHTASLEHETRATTSRDTHAPRSSLLCAAPPVLDAPGCRPPQEAEDDTWHNSYRGRPSTRSHHLRPSTISGSPDPSRRRFACGVSKLRSRSRPW